MRKNDFNDWVNFVRTAFPSFNPLASDLMLEAWQEVLKNASLEQAKIAVRQYVVEKSSKYEPQPKEIAEILKANKPNVIDLTEETEKARELDYDLRYQQLDKENGDMSWLVPHYQQVWVEIKDGKYPFVQDKLNPTHEEFREALKRFSQVRWGRWWFCESKNQIDAMTPEEQEKLRKKCEETLRFLFSPKTFNSMGIR